MTNLQRRVTIGSAWCGGVLALIVVACDAGNQLRSLEWWLYDRRAATCQFFTPAPTDKIVHLDIDDEALDAIGPWPWRRSMLAAMLEEIRLANPKAVAIDVLFAEPQHPTIEEQLDGKFESIDEDGAMADALGKLGNVVLPMAVSFLGQNASSSPLRAAAIEQLQKNILLDSSGLARQLTAKGYLAGEVASLLDVNFVDIRSDAMREIIRRHLTQGPRSLEQIMRELEVESTAASKSDRATTSPATAPATQPGTMFRSVAPYFARQYQRVSAEQAIQRFSLPGAAKLIAPPPDVEINLAPLTRFGQVIADCGFADYDIFKEPVVRAVPLFLRHGDRLYPQLALAVACRMLDIDLAAARVEDDQVLLTAPGGPIRIPVRSQYSSTVKRKVGTLMDIPWFGTDDWHTMYDWPAHQRTVRHYSINVAGDIVDARRKMARNNFKLDAALITGLLSPADAEKYAARNLPPDDTASRRAVAAQTLSDLQADGYDELFRTKPDSELADNERIIRDRMVAVRAALQENTELEERIQRKRKELAGMIADKGVLIGWVASGTGDVVTTSIHPRCPGVAVHGVIINAIVNRSFLRTAPRWATILLTLFFGLLATAITSRMPPVRAALLVALVAIVFFAANGILFYSSLRIILNAAAPLVALVVCWAGAMVVRLIIEGLERIRISRESAVIEHEISLARKVQQALIPKELKILTTIESHGWTLAATTTGGDCFDLWKLADGRLGILVADASGHGLGPSLIVLQVRALVRALCDLYTDPQKLLERVNQRLASDLDGSKFATAFLGFVTEDGRLSWGSAGHGPMLSCPAPNGEPNELASTGLPLGVSEEWFGEESVPDIQLEPGGWLAVISDGIFEAPNPAGEQFDIPRVKEAIAQSSSGSCEQIVDTLRDAVHRWQVKDEPVDDQTIVIIRRIGAAAKVTISEKIIDPDNLTAPVHSPSPHAP